ncbi:hypothetical protein H5399_01215 [Tessaracoccus sp. MC1627]|jgi:uncharacterized protein YjcR|uniref:hypothetical protein n=1 Tax=Tessaracoccus sp. MC1627 TaxID=2760312 RepID=UPI0015FF925A|nr:hypothetical protein [Tessaracoccus sp. MC1627]MBB1511231.1 hypothetical protein [Tessaracoccus sp. MC1627]
MAEPHHTVTPEQLAVELGASVKTVQAWLRDQGWQSVPYDRRHLTPEQAAELREWFKR